MEEGAQKQEIQNKKAVRRLGKNLLLVVRQQLAAFAKQAGRVSSKGWREPMK